MQVQSIYDLNISIDDLNIFEAPGVVFNSADIYESIGNPLPVCEISLIVPLDWINNRSIVDGTKFKFHIVSKTLDIDEVYTFRLFNIKKLEQVQNNVNLLIEGILDFYDGYSHANDFNMYGPSSEIFKTIASTFGITADIDSTNDSQLWVAGQKNIFQFFNYLMHYGWVNETSAMFWCFDRKKTLLYKNLTTLFRNRQDKVYSFIQASIPNLKNKQFVYSKVVGSIQSGVNNLRNDGYGGSDTYFDLLSYNWIDVSAKKVVAESNLINISKDLSRGLSQEWFSFDVGNFHKNYYLAYKQNKRILSTYSSFITLTTEYLQKFRLGEIVNFDYIDSKDQSNKLTALSGVYMIDAIHTKISLSKINSSLELVMQGLNGKAITQETY